jgi:TRAP-type uncharacterized transport system fused permease subunit
MSVVTPPVGLNLFAVSGVALGDLLPGAGDLAAKSARSDGVQVIA